MGIKFLCPNGHKLHVKAFLSGKRAICPKCGARVVVPPESPTAVEQSAPARGAGVPEQSVELPFEESLVDEALETMAEPAAAAEAKAATKSPPPPPGSTDPVDDAPGAIWYVRPASGGQFGPASAEIMRNWLKEGRVGANALVWRAGWTEWRGAAATFPQLGSSVSLPSAQSAGTGAGNGMPPLPVGQTVQTVAPSPTTTELPDADPPSMQPLARAARKRRRKKDVRLMASAILAAVSLILVIVLVLVSRAKSEPGDPQIEEPAAVDEEVMI